MFVVVTMLVAVLVLVLVLVAVIVVRIRLVLVVTVMMIKTVAMVVFRRSFRHRCGFVVVLAANRDLHPGNRTHRAPPNLLRSYLKLVRQLGHARAQTGSYVVPQLVGIARSIEAGRKEHIARGSRKTIEVGMVLPLFLMPLV